MAIPATRKKDDIKMYVLIDMYHNKQKGTFLVSDSKNPEGGERIPVESEFPRYVSVPNTDTVIREDGRQEKIRYIKGCPYIEVEKQMENKWTPNLHGDLIEVIDNQLLNDVTKDKTLDDFLSLCNYVEGNPRRDDTRRAIIRVSNRDAEQKQKLNTAYQYAKAIHKIENMSYEEAEMLLMRKGFIGGADMDEGVIKERLLIIAETEPEFIINGLQEAIDRRIVLARKVVEKGHISLATPATATWMKNGKSQSVIAHLGDLGGMDGKFDRFVDFLGTNDGNIVLNRIIELVGDVPYGQNLGGTKTEFGNALNPIDEVKHEITEPEDEDEGEGQEWADTDDESNLMTKPKKRGRPRKNM